MTLLLRPRPLRRYNPLQAGCPLEPLSSGSALRGRAWPCLQPALSSLPRGETGPEVNTGTQAKVTAGRQAGTVPLRCQSLPSLRNQLVGRLVEPRLRSMLCDTSYPPDPTPAGNAAPWGGRTPTLKACDTPRAPEGAGLRIRAPSSPGSSPPGCAAASLLPFPAAPRGAARG